MYSLQSTIFHSILLSFPIRWMWNGIWLKILDAPLCTWNISPIIEAQYTIFLSHIIILYYSYSRRDNGSGYSHWFILMVYWLIITSTLLPFHILMRSIWNFTWIEILSKPLCTWNSLSYMIEPIYTLFWSTISVLAYAWRMNDIEE